jgi:predicted metal-dependent hydrolase
MMAQQIQLGDITVDVVLKDIKNIHLSVYPPLGAVRIAAPARMDLDTIRVYAISKLGWIRKHRDKIRAQQRETPREYLDRESHTVWGRRYLLRIVEADKPPAVELSPNTLYLHVRPGTSATKREAVLTAWYRQQLQEVAPALIAKWEPVMGVKVARLSIRQMKTRWGSCTPATRAIRLNTELAKKPAVCLEYIVVHELAHLLEPSHNQRFVSLMNGFLPQWRDIRDLLNDQPVRHEQWRY